MHLASIYLPVLDRRSKAQLKKIVAASMLVVACWRNDWLVKQVVAAGPGLNTVTAHNRAQPGITGQVDIAQLAMRLACARSRSIKFCCSCDASWSLRVSMPNGAIGTSICTGKVLTRPMRK